MLSPIRALAILLAMAACAPSDAERSEPTRAELEPGVVEIVARDLTLSAPDTVAAGWTTFRFVNTSPMTHFAVVERLPEGKGMADQQAEVAPVFQAGFDLLSAGSVDDAMATFGTLPTWFGEIVFLGGPGLTSPGQTSQATVHLRPGVYLLECYVKTDGVFHSYNPTPGGIGMVHEFVVAPDSNGVAEPEPDIRLTISSEAGIVADVPVMAGARTVAVHFEDQTVHENFVGHDVHVVQLSEGTDLAALEAWMDWSTPLGLQTPAPAVFVGGTNEMPSGSTAFFTVVFEPGQYAWIAEVPGAEAKGMFVPFTVTAAGGP